MRKQGHSGFALKIYLLLIGAGLMAWGGQYAALALLGQSGRAVIEYSVRQYGASRGTFYTVHYAFDVPHQGRYRGTASARSDHPPAGLLWIRYLGFRPGINHPGGNALLTFYSALLLLPGALLAFGSARALKRRPSSNRNPT